MNFMDKIEFLHKEFNNLHRLVKIHLILRRKGCPDSFLNLLTSKFPKLPLSYINFLKLYGDPELGWFKFYGDLHTQGISLFDMLEIWEEDGLHHFEKNGYCPMGCDAGGDLYCLNEKGQVIMFDSINVEEPPRFIAESFESFMDECVLGKRYPQMSIENSSFHQFLKQQGWA